MRGSKLPLPLKGVVHASNYASGVNINITNINITELARLEDNTTSANKKLLISTPHAQLCTNFPAATPASLPTPSTCLAATPIVH